ncbi:MAG: hypothetical protein ACKPDI_13600 [Actinomycetota bacterium]
MSDLPPPSMPPPPPPDGLTPPPGYVPYGPGGQRGFQSIGGLTKWLVIAVAATIATQALSLVAQLTLRDDAVSLADNLDELTGRLGFYLLASLLAAAVGVTQLVLLIIWTFRMAKNLELLGRKLSFSAGATIAVNILGGCTLGILNFFMWKEQWQASDPAVAAHDPAWKRAAIAPVIIANLVLGLLGTAVGLTLGLQAGFGGFGNTDTSTLGQNLSDRFGFVVVSGVLTLAAAATFLVLVRRLAARHMRAIGEV